MSGNEIRHDPHRLERLRLLQGIRDDICNYFLDFAEDFNWEDFDPELDELRTKVQELMGAWA